MKSRKSTAGGGKSPAVKINVSVNVKNVADRLEERKISAREFFEEYMSDYSTLVFDVERWIGNINTGETVYMPAAEQKSEKEMEILEIRVTQIGYCSFKISDTVVGWCQVLYAPDQSPDRKLTCTCSMGKRPCEHVDYLDKYLSAYSTSHIRSVLNANCPRGIAVANEYVQELRIAVGERTSIAWRRRAWDTSVLQVVKPWKIYFDQAAQDIDEPKEPPSPFSLIEVDTEVDDEN
jgi:hypothetical protein